MLADHLKWVHYAGLAPIKYSLQIRGLSLKTFYDIAYKATTKIKINVQYKNVALCSFNLEESNLVF